MGSTVMITIKKAGSQAAFDPPSQPAAVGDDVYWRNEDTQAHWPTPRLKTTCSRLSALVWFSFA